MEIVNYSEDYADNLRLALRRSKNSPSFSFGARLLRSEAFLNHMFMSHPDSRLYLLLSDKGDILATLGSREVTITVGQQRHRAAVMSNTYSFQGGAFSFLLLHWMRTAEVGIVLPGSVMLNRLIERQERWHRVTGVRTYILNWNYPTRPADALWKRLAKPPLRAVSKVNAEKFPARVQRVQNTDLSVEEVSRIEADMVLDGGCFGFRIEANLEHLNWRFSTSIPYINHRVFRIRKAQETRGYVVIAEWPNRIVVFRTDGDDPSEIAFGVLLSVAAVNKGGNKYREVLLSSSHSEMISIFSRFGFRPRKEDTLFYVAQLSKRNISVGDSSNWLVGFELGDQYRLLIGESEEGLLDLRQDEKTNQQ